MGSSTKSSVQYTTVSATGDFEKIPS